MTDSRCKCLKNVPWRESCIYCDPDLRQFTLEGYNESIGIKKKNEVKRRNESNLLCARTLNR
jgi:hypothetical protein